MKVISCYHFNRGKVFNFILQKRVSIYRQVCSANLPNWYRWW